MNATIESMSDSAHLYWEAQAATFDDEPDHALLHPEIRDGWHRLLLEHLPPAPADVRPRNPHASAAEGCAPSRAMRAFVYAATRFWRQDR
jgi:hypothetical protein